MLGSSTGRRPAEPVPDKDSDELREALALRRHALNTTHSHNVERTDHDSTLATSQRNNDLIADHSGVLGMLDAKNLSAAAVNLERPEWCVFQKLPHLFKHAQSYNARPAGASQPTGFNWAKTVRRALKT
jgi:hypothetical protein